ncbi:phosphoglucomutase/phosphomannomutase alpha/beta/alpha domain I [Staphylothermus marinus F1]|uniref:Phosphoglucomutase/phosphomannomutase alpha/beta/alpha domain I n=1 Tax=Staphylothermus marinus (strain ATCC 43588 / DSM 3639 / JCM 9404 / F1) TaxID=399550 RepID=A3DP17_STAMF|nr:phosphoglucosamine mutase [Staphylothermus marinus]ABN70377.1 phosphoglucomutase/phosphomannomutase alpha/beta/alpha domain I [Staphylothermus marinus F1]
MGRLFGTDGVRGIINEELTPELALKLGMAIGTFFGEGSKILVGRDVRAGGYMIKSAVIAGLLSAGVKVYDGELAPTPALQYAVKTQDFDGGVIITASHNPSKYNGIKVVAADGIEVPREKELEIEEIYFSQRFRRVPWRQLIYDAKPYPYVNDIYVKGVIEKVDKDLIRSKGFKIVIDPANSVGALTSPRIARELGVKVYTVNGHLDPTFPGREPEPIPEHLGETARTVVSIGAVLGVAHDGDADRAIFIDDKGRVQWGDRTATILARYLVEKHPELPRKVYTAVSSSTIIEEILKPLGIEVVWLKVGSVDISRTMQRNNDALCGFEENGGFMYPPHQLVRDGGMTLALMLEMIAKENRKLSEIYDDLPQYHLIKTKIPMTRDKALLVVEQVKEYFKNYRQITIDGVKVISDDFWLLVRPSGTEPLLRIMLEAKTKEKAEELLSIVKKIAEEVTGKK